MKALEHISPDDWQTTNEKACNPCGDQQGDAEGKTKEVKKEPNSRVKTAEGTRKRSSTDERQQVANSFGNKKGDQGEDCREYHKLNHHFPQEERDNRSKQRREKHLGPQDNKKGQHDPNHIHSRLQQAEMVLD